MNATRDTFCKATELARVEILDYGRVKPPFAAVSYLVQMFRPFFKFSKLTITAVDCGTLNNPMNGRVTVVETTLGAPAVYTCNPGYKLMGVERRLCTASGRWSDQEPFCMRKFKREL